MTPHYPLHVRCHAHAVRSWIVSRSLLRKHPHVFHTLYAVSHFTYLCMVAVEGHGWYALAAIPAAVAYVGSYICFNKDADE